jgi:hypothetical protein
MAAMVEMATIFPTNPGDSTQKTLFVKSFFVHH